MDAGLLDVLHHAADDHVVAVGDHVDVDLDGVGQELVDQDRRVLLAVPRAARLSRRDASIAVSTKCSSPDGVVDDLHRAAAEHVRRAHHHRVADALGDLARLVQAVRGAPGGRAQAQLREQLAEALAVLGAVDGVGAGAEQLDARVLSGTASFSGVCPPNWTITPFGLLGVDDLEHVLERERLEVQPVGGVVVGRHRLRVAVDHDGLEARLRAAP